jgi:uncharacterized membrane protein HdeD (DUF308 family)
MENSLKTIQDSVKHWYAPLILGLIFIFTGIYCLFNTGETYTVLSQVLAYSIMISGLIEILFLYSKIKEGSNWQWALVFGLTELAIGFILFRNPEISFVFLSIVVAFMVLIRSLSAIGKSIELRTLGTKDWWVLSALGVIGVIMAFILMNNPQLAGMTVAFWIGLALIMLGMFSVFLSLKFRKIKKAAKKIPAELKSKWSTLNNEIKEKLNE